LDLTSRNGGYYRRSEFGVHGIPVASVPFPPHQVPPAHLVEEALQDVHRMWRDAGPESIVLVHCTHGLNRTGAFVCAALQRFVGMDEWTAMMTFQNARPPGMQQQHPNVASWEGAQPMGKK
jgi:protein-tyrosine phosphatase